MRQRQSAKIELLQLLAVIAASLVSHQSEAATTSSFNATLTCSMVRSGTFLKDPRACDTWIECVDGEPVSDKCSSGLFYDLSTNTCVDPDTVTCYSSEPCETTLADGFVVDPYSCNGYYYCYKGSPVRGECSAGLVFDAGTLVCVRGSTCTRVDPDSLCNIVPDLVFISDPLTCQGYHLCLDGVLENGTCADGYYFDALKGVCGYDTEVKCNIPPLHPDLPGGGICEVAGQFVSDNQTCAGYYYCKEVEPGDFWLVWGHCPTGRFFDPTNGGECVNRRQIECDYDRCDAMGSTRIQLANAPNDGCRGYLVCQDGKEIASAVCPEDEPFFSEVSERCTSDVVSFTACASVATTAVETTASTTLTTPSEATTVGN